MSAPKTGATRPGAGTIRSLLFIGAYYAIFTAIIAYFWPRSNLLRAAFSFERFEVDPIRGEIIETFSDPGISAIGEPGDGLWIAVLSVVGALAIMVPVAWSYIVIKRRGDYEQSVVQTLITLPIAVTGVVIIVQNSIALAFSLAGIVAAVRFRTTLRDVKDGVYVFLAIGVGLACGVQALGVAVVLSVFFNLVNLGLWRADFGNIYADQGSRTGALALGDVLAGPGSARTALSIGDRRLLEAMSPADLKDVAERVARLGQHLDAEVDAPKEKKAYSLLIVHSTKPGEAQKHVEEELARMALRWRLAEILPGEGDHSVLEYLVRLQERFRSGDLLQAIRATGGDAVKAAEIRSLTGRSG